MGAENHCEVKVTFSKGVLKISEGPFPIVNVLFEDQCNIVDNISNAILAESDSELVDLMRTTSEAVGESVFASNPCLMSAIISQALRRLVEDLNGEEHDNKPCDIVSEIMRVAENSFVQTAKRDYKASGSAINAIADNAQKIVSAYHEILKRKTNDLMRRITESKSENKEAVGK